MELQDEIRLNLFKYFEGLSFSKGVSSQYSDGVCFLQTNLPSAFMNPIFRIKGNPEANQEMLDKVYNFYKSFQTISFSWWEKTIKDQNLVKTFFNHVDNFILNKDIIGMALIKEEFKESMPVAGVKVKRVYNLEIFEDWVKTVSLGSEAGEYTLQFENIFRSLVNSEEFRYFIAYYNQIPISCALSFRPQGSKAAGIYWIATLPKYRKQGIGSHITSQVIKDAFESKCDAIILQCVSAGAKLYKNLGFKTYSGMDHYVFNIEKSFGDSEILK